MNLVDYHEIIWVTETNQKICASPLHKKYQNSLHRKLVYVFKIVCNYHCCINSPFPFKYCKKMFMIQLNHLLSQSNVKILSEKYWNIHLYSILLHTKPLMSNRMALTMLLSDHQSDSLHQSNQLLANITSNHIWQTVCNSFTQTRQGTSNECIRYEQLTCRSPFHSHT